MFNFGKRLLNQTKLQKNRDKKRLKTTSNNNTDNDAKILKQIKKMNDENIKLLNNQNNINYELKKNAGKIGYILLDNLCSGTEYDGTIPEKIKKKKKK